MSNHDHIGTSPDPAASSPGDHAAAAWSPPGLERALAGWTEGIAAYSRQVVANADWVDALPEQATAVRTALSPLARTFADFAVGMMRLIPENLRHLRGEDWITLIDICEEQAIAAAWVLEPAVISDLLADTSKTGRSAVVDHHASAIFDKCERVLDDLRHEDLTEVGNFVRQSIAAYRDGHTSAAQALSTNCLETSLEQHVKQKSSGAIRYIKGMLQLQKDEGKEKSVRVLRWRLATAGIPRAYRHYAMSTRGDLYNRNGTVHAVNPALYTRGNAARATALATSWLRWLQEMHDEGEREEIRSTS